MQINLAPILEKQSKKYLKLLRSTEASLRKENAELRRQVQTLQKSFARMQGQKLVGSDFSSARLRAHREQLGISAQDYAALAGVSALSIYHWESEKAHPRRAQIERLSNVQELDRAAALSKLQKLKGASKQRSRSSA